MRKAARSSVLITGGATGIGRATAAVLVASGAKVTVLGRRADALSALRSELGPSVCEVVGDVRDPDVRARALAAAVEHGEGALDGLVHCAADTHRSPVEVTDEQRVLELFHTNVVAALALTGAARGALERAAGCIVFVSSVQTRRGVPGGAAYAATKGAVEALTVSLAAELGPAGIRVGCVRPGAVPTEINLRAGLVSPEQNEAAFAAMGAYHALGVAGSPHDVAEAIAYVLGAPWFTGAILTIDGGLSLGLSGVERSGPTR